MLFNLIPVLIYYLDQLFGARSVTVSVGITVWILTASFVGGGWIKFVFMPEVEADNVVALLTMPQGTSKEQTEKIIKKIEESAVFLNDELNNEGKGPIQHILASVGDQPFLSRQFGAAGYGGVASSSHLGEVNLQLVSAEIREITSIAIAPKMAGINGNDTGGRRAGVFCIIVFSRRPGQYSIIRCKL